MHTNTYIHTGYIVSNEQELWGTLEVRLGQCQADQELEAMSPGPNGSLVGVSSHKQKGQEYDSH